MTQAALNSPSSLQDAFEVFNALSQNLTRSYAELEAQAARLAGELAAARSEKLKTLTEKEQLANRLQRLLEALPGGVLVTDGEGLIVEHNPAAARLLGDGLLGRRWRDVLGAVSLPDSENPHQRQLLNGASVSVSVNSLGDEPGQIVLLTDVSEMRALQELLNQQKRLSTLGEMVASLAHQVRTPLAAALLYTGHLGNAELTDAQRSRFAGKLTERLMHLERQVNDMLSFARMGRMTMESIPVARFLQQLADSVEPALVGKPIRFQLLDRSGCEAFHGNQDALLGILLNLLNNAVDALGGRDGSITVTLDHTATGRLRIVVADDGPGVAEDISNRIFEPFFTTRPNGTGLGLAVVDCVARAHGGAAFCESSSERGTRFVVELPLTIAADPLPGGYSGEQLGEAHHATP